ncbi:MAG: YeeE/YedE family protein [Rhodobacteraceae bacterium]|nr:YeeE/YedE family protein [Paracoccaceae bacterium]
MEQDWWFGLLGGGLIGVSASIFLLFNGKIMGASGIMGGLVDGSGRKDMVERLSFIAGLIFAPYILTLLWVTPETNLTGNIWVLVGSGLLVGIGSRLANGCTSGHGICGISRLSLRGILATVAYLFAGAVAMLLFRHIWGFI